MEENKHPTFGNGKICYIELPAVDVQQSANFYKTVFDWQIRQSSDGFISFDDSVGEVSGTWVTGRKAATGLGLLIHIMVNSVADTLQVIIAHGGNIVQSPVENAPEITARFSDPAGNIIGLYEQPA